MTVFKIVLNICVNRLYQLKKMINIYLLVVMLKL